MEDEEQLPLSATEVCVRYTGTSNYRLMSRFDLSGDLGDNATEQMEWTPGSEVLWATWLDFAGSEERALEVFRRHNHEFEIVGPGAGDILDTEDGEEDFAIGGLVTE